MISNGVKRIILIDSHSLIHRAFHALPGLRTPDGKPSQAAYGFTSMLLKMLGELEPDFVFAAFDLPGPTFRHIAYERYKAHRPKAPDELITQIPMVREILEAFGIPVIQKEGYEADDVIGTLAESFSKKKDYEVVIVSGDLDALQLVRPRVSVFTLKKGISDTILYDEKAVRERFGFGPEMLVDYKGLRGDPSDNIPGVKGIGEKIATELLQKYGSVENTYKALKKRGAFSFSDSVRKKLEEGEENARISKELALIARDAPVSVTLEEGEWRGMQSHKDKLEPIFEKFGFSSFLKRLHEQPRTENEQTRTAPGPATLFEKETEAPKQKEVKITNGKDWHLLPVSSLRGTRLAFLFDEASKTFFILPYTAEPSETVRGRTRSGFRPEGSSEFFAVPEKLLRSREAEDFFTATKGVDLITHDLKAFLKLAPFAEGWGTFFDCKLAWFIADPGRRDYSLGKLVSWFLQKDVADISTGDLLALLPRIARRLRDDLEKNQLLRIFEEFEMPLPVILAAMERWGIGIDTGYLLKLSQKTKKEIGILEEKIYKNAGESFNINSSQQLSEILFTKLGLGKSARIKKTGTGRLSTNIDQLSRMQKEHPIIPFLIEYRELAKLQSTYIEALPKLVDLGGRIHTTFHQTGTVTGRLSSSDPNVQNIPTKTLRGKEIRAAFVAEKGFSFLAFDYSQLELRIAAHLAGDKKMIDAFTRGMDIHTLTAAEVNDTTIEKVTPEMRRAAKALNFGILYGMGVRSFAESAGIPLEQAKKFFSEYFSDFSGIANYIAETKEKARIEGYVETAFGRRRYLPQLFSGGFREVAEAERMAVNAPIQGTAADILKRAMIRIWAAFAEDFKRGDLRMLLQVHDELIFEAREEKSEHYKTEIKKIMESCFEGAVPFPVDAHEGKTWAEL
ncbi:MAG: DNA polymerase I [bacterium]|nr:DNA polymerase I [bacterium]